MINRDQIEVLIDNLIRLQSDAQSIREEEFLFLRAYFSSMITPEMTFDRAMRQLLGGYKRLVAEQTSAVPENQVREKSALSQTLAECFFQEAPSPKAVIPSLFASKSDSVAKISFWRENQFSSIGVELFSELFHSTEPIFSESFSETCENVANQTSEFGILPIDNTVDGRLSVFYKMIDKYELKICAVCDVEDPATEMSTRLALVAKKLYSFEGAFPRHIELSRVVTDPKKRIELVRVAEFMGAALTHLSSRPLSYRINANIETMRFALKEEITVPFLIYLHIFCEDINILGFFVQI